MPTWVDLLGLLECPRAVPDRARPERDNLGSWRIMERQLRRHVGSLFRIHFQLTAGGMVTSPNPASEPA